MGCCLSAFTNNSDEINNTLNGYYAATSYRRRSSKQICFSQISNGSSSGVFSACNSPSRRSILSRSKSKPLSSHQTNAIKPTARCSKLTHKNFSTGFEMLSICDDFGEAEKVQQHQSNKSVGYYSDSVSMEGSVPTPSQSSLVRTQDTSLSPLSPLLAMSLTATDLEMEMYIISQSKGWMPKTSSPMFQRKDVKLDAVDVAVASPASHSYQKWANYLQSTPTYMVQNITDIPEAIAGHFSPLDFPAFTDLEEMESAAKRFKVDIHSATETQMNEEFYGMQISKPSNKTHTITTDL